MAQPSINSTIVVIVAGLFLANCLAGQERQQTVGSSRESLLIGPGDTISIKVFDTPEMDQHPRVTDAGDVPLMFVGNLKIAGMTPAQAGHTIEEALIAGNYMLRPQVSVTVEAYATQDVSVMGQVKDPGRYDLETATPILKVLSMAGGLTDLADRNVTIERRGDQKNKITYYLSNRSDEAIQNEIMVYPGDLVLVPRVGVVYVLGDVARPGGFPMSTNDSKMTVLQALALAGTLNHTAAGSKAKLVRRSASGPQDIPLQLSDMQKGKLPDLEMQPDDVIFIPFSWMKNMAMASSSILTTAATASIYAHP